MIPPSPAMRAAAQELAKSLTAMKGGWGECTTNYIGHEAATEKIAAFADAACAELRSELIEVRKQSEDNAVCAVKIMAEISARAEVAEAALAKVRAETIEECAKVVEKYLNNGEFGGGPAYSIPILAAAIRARANTEAKP